MIVCVHPACITGTVFCFTVPVATDKRSFHVSEEESSKGGILCYSTSVPSQYCDTID